MDGSLKRSLSFSFESTLTSCFSWYSDMSSLIKPWEKEQQQAVTFTEFNKVIKLNFLKNPVLPSCCLFEDT